MKATPKSGSRFYFFPLDILWIFAYPPERSPSLARLAMRLDYLLQAHAFATTAERLPLKRAQQRIREVGLQVDGTLVRDPKHQVVPGVELITDTSGGALEVDYAFCLLNKPAGHVSQRHPTEANVYDLIPPELARPDLAAFGRLDRDTTGTLLLGT